MGLEMKVCVESMQRFGINMTTNEGAKENTQLNTDNQKQIFFNYSGKYYSQATSLK